MNRIAHAIRAAALLAVLGAALGLGLPAAGADEGPPPVSTPAPGPNTPALPAGDAHAPPGGCAYSQPVLINSAPQDIHDLTTITSTLIITSSDHFLWNMSLETKILHSYNRDLLIRLVSPQHTTVTLSDRLGGGHGPGDVPGNVFADTLWDDQAALFNGTGQPVTDYPFVPGTNAAALNPQEPLAAFYGEDPNGTWALVISDEEAGDEGTLEGWSLLPTILNHGPALQTATLNESSRIETIPDGGQVRRSLPFFVPLEPLTSLTVTAVITHSDPGHLNVYLLSPQGVTLTLSTGNGGTRHNVFAGTTWFDAAGKTLAPGAVSEHSFTADGLVSPLAPEEAFGELNGIFPIGQWTLVVQDSAVNGQSGQLGPVTMALGSAACAPDLLVSAVAAASLPRIGTTPADINFDVYNFGLGASGVMLTATLSSPALFQSLNAGAWSCTAPAVNTLGPTIQCSLASLPSQEFRRLTVRVAGLPQPGYIPISATTGVAGPDTNAGDNHIVTSADFSAYSANKNPWDVQTTDGRLLDGGQDAFDGWGQIRVAVYKGLAKQADALPAPFGLAFTPGNQWSTTSPRAVDSVLVSRDLYAPLGTDWLRYLDTFTNMDVSTRTVIVAWGGNLGSDSNTQIAASASGDKTIGANDRWGMTIEQPGGSGPASDAVLGYVLRSPDDTSFLGPVDTASLNIAAPWSGAGNEDLGFGYLFTLPPGGTVRLAYFVYRGLSEGEAGPQDCLVYGGCVTPPAGSQVTLVKNAVTLLAAVPGFCDLDPAVTAQIVNWPHLVSHCLNLPAVRR